MTYRWMFPWIANCRQVGEGFRSNLAYLGKILSDKSVYSLLSAVVVDSMIWIDFEAYGFISLIFAASNVPPLHNTAKLGNKFVLLKTCHCFLVGKKGFPKWNRKQNQYIYVYLGHSHMVQHY